MTNELPFNPFDGAAYLCLAVAVIAGLRSGLMRSLATIAGYLIAAPVAVAVTPYLVPLVNARLQLTPAQLPLLFFAVFFVIGFLLAALMRGAVGEITGHRIGVVDRAAGAFLGAIRVVLLAVLIVMVFDRIIPPGREPEFLAQSKLRPILSEAGRQGLRQLPPDVAEFIDRVKRERGL